MTVYCSVSRSEGIAVVGRSKFYSIWLPQIAISKPSSDLCFTCQANSTALQKSGHGGFIQKSTGERDYYNDHVEVAVESNKSSSPRIGNYSYDFATTLLTLNRLSLWVVWCL